MASLTHSTADHHLRLLADFIAQNIDLLKTHPNDGDASIIPGTWTASSEQLARYYSRREGGDDLPESLREFIDGIRELELPRKPIDMSKGGLMDLPTKKGMSPKKFHEVQRLVTYVKTLVDGIRVKSPDLSEAFERLRIVDVGAGQGYLTRALAASFPGARLLALDADHSQTEGAERFGNPSKAHRSDPQATKLNSRIDRRTVLITPESLLQVVDDWVFNAQTADVVNQPPIPVLFVALHACGSLTPDMLRAFLSRAGDSKSILRTWRPLSVVAIGCCYNLMFPGDYPLSSTLRLYPSVIQNPLPSAAYHLAAQIPMTWLKEDRDTGVWKIQSTVQMAIRKITWRALLQFALGSAEETVQPDGSTVEGRKGGRSASVPVKWWTLPPRGSEPSAAPMSLLPSVPELSKAASPPAFDRLIKVKEAASPTERTQGEGVTDTGKRLGKLPSSTYMQGWTHFLGLAGERLGVRWAMEDLESLHDAQFEKRVEVLHTLRCFLGSVVETAILMDRLQWVREALGHHGKRWECGSQQQDWSVELVNLFDQDLGSGRNIGLVIAPVVPVYSDHTDFGA